MTILSKCNTEQKCYIPQGATSHLPHLLSPNSTHTVQIQLPALATHLHNLTNTFVVHSSNDLLYDAKCCYPENIIVWNEVFIGEETNAYHPVK